MSATDPINLHDYEHLSPFEITNALIRLANDSGRTAAHTLLNAGRGNPNWLATRAREVFFRLGQFAIAESQRAMTHPSGLGGMPRPDGLMNRLEVWLATHDTEAAAGRLIRFAIDTFSFRPDTFVHELIDAIIGDNYPSPPRILHHTGQIVHEYLGGLLCGASRPPGRFDLFATEGGTAAIAYVFRTLRANRLLRPGDRIALGTPVFSPYLEIPGLEDYGLESVYVEARPEDGFQFASAQLEKLTDPRIKAFFLVNPGNPTSVALSPETRRLIVTLVTTHRPDLMLLTDDVYAPFVDGFRSLLAELPHNTIGVYSYSKYFGATGWRLGVIAIHEDNMFDRAIASLPDTERHSLSRRYGTLAPHPESMKFIDRMVADSRDVALNHTAGLSSPQQAMMMLFSLAELADRDQRYRSECVALLERRVQALRDGLGEAADADPLNDHYYGLIDLELWLRRHLGEDIARFVREHVHPLDIVFRLARDHGIVVLNGGGFHAPDWSVRVSFANLDDAVYRDIGRALRAVTGDYVRAYHAARPAAGP